MESIFRELLNPDDPEVIPPPLIQFLVKLSKSVKWKAVEMMLLQNLRSRGHQPALDYLFIKLAPYEGGPNPRYIALISNVRYRPGMKVSLNKPNIPHETLVLPGTAIINQTIYRLNEDKKVADITPAATHTRIEEMD